MKMKVSVLILFLLLSLGERSLIYGQASGDGDMQPDSVAFLSLDEAKRLARSNNRDVRILRLNLRIAREKTREARSKAFPQVSSSYGYLVNDKETPGNDQGFGEGSVSLEQILFHLGIWAGIRAAKSYQRMEELDVVRFHETLDLLTTEAYLELLRLQKNISVLRELEKNTGEHLRNAQNFYQEGMVPKTDLLKTELALSKAQRDLLSAENAQQKAWTALKILIGAHLDQSYEVQEVESMEMKDKEMNEIKEKALAHRLDLQRVMAENSYLTNLCRTYQSRRYPNLSAFGSWNHTTNKYEPEENSLTGGVRLNLPIFTGFNISAQIAQAKAQLAQNEIRHKDLVAKIHQEVESAYLDIHETRVNLETAQKEVCEAEENLRITNDLFKESMAATTDVLDAQTLLAQARNHLNNVRYDQIMAVQRLSLAVGSDNL